MSDAGNVDDPGFVYDAGRTLARIAGYAWDEINGWFNDRTDAAKDAGYSDSEIASATGRQSPDEHAAALLSVARVNGASDPTQFDALKTATDPAVTPLEAPAAARISDLAGVVSPPPQMPEGGHAATTPIDFNDATARGAYADALRTGAVQTPSQFAEQYAGAYLGAAAQQLPELTGSAHAAVVRSAGNLAASLPTDEDFTDTAIAIAHSTGVALTPDGVATVKNNLADDWVDTNRPLQELYQKAQADPEYAAKLAAPPPSASDNFLNAMVAPVAYLANTLLNGPGLPAKEPDEPLTPEEVKDTFAQSNEITKAPVAYYNSPDFDKLPPAAQQTVRAYASGEAKPVSMAMVADEVALTHSKSIGEAAENFGFDVASLYGLNLGLKYVLAPAARYVVNQVKGFFPSAATPLEDALMEKAGAQWRSIMPEGGPTFDQAITQYSPDALLAAAREQGPVHAEAARISMLPEVDREAELAKLEVPPAAAEGAPPIEAPAVDRAKVEELLPAYDAAGGVYGWAKGLLHDILDEDNGALQLFHGTGVNFAAERGAPFGRFQMEKIGAGEGAQLYSHGLYFAQDERISRWYRDMDVQRKGVPTSDGSLYTVHVDADPETQMLDWDRKLGDQHADVQQMLNTVPELKSWAERQAAVKGGESVESFLNGMTGEDLYKRLMMEKGATVAQTQLPSGAPNRLASEALRDAGFKGMQYADASTRGLPFDQRSFNHVIYDPSVVKITHRNGVPVPANTLFADLQQLMTEGQSKVAGVLEGIHARLPSWDTPARSIEKALYDARREEARRSIIKNAIQRPNQMVQETAYKLDKLRGLVSPHVKEFEAATSAKDVPRATNSVIGQLISYIENRTLGATLQNSKLQPIADALRDVNLAQRGRLQQAFNDGLIGLNEYRDNYFRHLWKNPRGAEWDRLWSGGVARQGSGQSLLQRTLPTVEDGLRAGLVPRISDPIDLALYDIGQKSRYLGSLQTIDDAIKAGHAYRSVSGPEAPTDRPLLGLKGSIAVNPGVTSVLYGKDGFHQLYNNAFSNGMFNHPSAAGTYEKLQWAANTATAMKLALPIFHMRVVGLASVASGIGQSLRELGRGEFKSAALHAGEATAILPRLGIDAKVGFDQIYKFKNAMADPIIQGLSDAGLRVVSRQAVYREAAESLVTTGLRGVTRGQGFVKSLTPENIKGFGGAIVRAIGKDLAAVKGDSEVETMAKRMMLGLPRALNVPFQEVGRLMQTATSPFFDHLIPALKAGAGYREMAAWLKANPTVSEEAKAIKYREVVKSLDNRFGELNQDTIFVPRLAKQIANTTLISPGWVYGSYRGFLGAMGIDVEKIYASGRGFQNPLSFRNASTVVTDTIGTVAAFAIFNTLEQYARTGTFPWQTDTPWHDLIAYRSGGVTKAGVERGSVPSELKEVFDIAKVIATGIAGYAAGGGGIQGAAIGVGRGAGATADYILAKVNPFLQAIKTIVSSEDGIGHKVLTPAGFSKFMKSAFSPIFLDAIANDKKGSAFGLVSSLLGDRAAPVASNWNGFIKTMEGVFQKENKAAESRARYENAQLVNPDTSIPPPPAGRYRAATFAGFAGADRAERSAPRETLQQRAERSLQAVEPLSERATRATRAAQYARSTDPYHQALVTVLNSRQDREAQQQRPYRGNSAELIVNGVSQQQPRPARHRAAVSRSIASLLLRSELRRRAALAYYRRQRAIGGGAQGIGAGYQGVTP